MNCCNCCAQVSRDHKVLKLELAYPLITIPVLQTLKSQLHLDSAFSPLEKRLLWAAFTMAFYGFLRASEFATPSLKWQHVQRTGNAYTIFIEQFKTDPFRCGHSITIYASGTSICPVRALQLYAEAVPQHQGNVPIFKGGRFSPFNHQQLTHTIRYVQQSTSYNKQYYSSHSLRSGAAIMLLKQAYHIGSLKPLADGTAMLTSYTYNHSQRD